jgi:DNA-binding transcriptional ArsR family regulator
MVNSRRSQLDEMFFALSDPTRRAMITRLARGDCTVAELAEPFDVSAAAISKQLRVLERAGLITQQRKGRARRCHLEAGPLQEVFDWLLQNTTHNMDN